MDMYGYLLIVALKVRCHIFGVRQLSAFNEDNENLTIAMFYKYLPLKGLFIFSSPNFRVYSNLWEWENKTTFQWQRSVRWRIGQVQWFICHCSASQTYRDNWTVLHRICDLVSPALFQWCTFSCRRYNTVSDTKFWYGHYLLSTLINVRDTKYRCAVLDRSFVFM